MESVPIDRVLQVLQDRYRKDDLLTVTHGKQHKYLGRTLDYSDIGKVKILMQDYTEKML